MPGPAGAYVAAIFGMLFAGISALALIYTVEHLDSADAPSQPEEVAEKVAV